MHLQLRPSVLLHNIALRIVM